MNKKSSKSHSVCFSHLLFPKDNGFRRETHVLGILPGEGIGPELTKICVDLLQVISEVTGVRFDIRYGDVIGKDAHQRYGTYLTDQVIDFAHQVFVDNGALLCGPGGGRFVYELRKQFDLFLKISPIQAKNGAVEASSVKAELLHDLDLLVVRENSGGIYQGSWSHSSNGQASAQHQFSYDETQVSRFLDKSARLAASRKGELAVAWKESGIPSISQLWRSCAEDIAKKYGVNCRMLDIDLMTYLVVANPRAFDVVATPNLFGDIIGDLCAILIGSRGVSFSGNFNGKGHGVYQTNHGSAYDIMGKNIANPAGQMLSLAMLLRESFGLDCEAGLIEKSMSEVWSEGYSTQDMPLKQDKTLGTKDWSEKVATKIAVLGNLVLGK